MKSAVDYIRQHLDFFFQRGQPTVGALVTLVVQDALEAGAGNVRIKCDGDYVGIFADIDWMNSPFAGFEELFQRLVPIGEKRPNAHRAEIVLMAVSSGVFVSGDGAHFEACLPEEDIPMSLRDLAAQSRRGLIWRLDGNAM